DATGAPIGGFVAAEEGDPANVEIAAVGSGFLVVWGRDGNTTARLFAADATPLGPSVTVATTFQMTDLAVNPTGARAAAVGVGHAGDPTPGEVRVRFFAPDGSFVGNDLVVGDYAGDAGVASDPNGNFLVVAGAGLHVRAYDPNGAPFGPVVTFAD